MGLLNRCFALQVIKIWLKQLSLCNLFIMTGSPARGSASVVVLLRLFSISPRLSLSIISGTVALSWQCLPPFHVQEMRESLPYKAWIEVLPLYDLVHFRSYVHLLAKTIPRGISFTDGFKLIFFLNQLPARKI